MSGSLTMFFRTRLRSNPNGGVDGYGYRTGFVLGTVIKNCLWCSIGFPATVTEVNRGFGKFCGRSCAAKFNNSKKEKKGKILTCKVCGSLFYRMPCELKKGSCRTCSKRCAAVLKGRENPPNFRHGVYANGGYREKALKHKESVCERCGWAVDVRGIDIHHKDRNRMNSNL